MPPRFSKETNQPSIFEAGPPSYQKRTSPCEANCPAGHSIQRTIRLIQDNRFEDALANVRARNPFPGVCGRVCFHPCEASCNRKFYDDGISVRALERAAADLADGTRILRPATKEKTGRRIAVIGSGPSGMTCAYFSALFGHDVTVFEASHVMGGIPRTCIPSHRLPEDIVDREVGEALGLGIKARLNTKVGKDISFGKILEGFDACLIAVGAWKERPLHIPGTELAQSALSFLGRVKRGERPDLGQRVVIVGGGGVAFDCASTARRLGATQVRLICLEPANKMLAPPEIIAQAAEEGISVHNMRIPHRVIGERGRLSGIECLEVQSFCFSPSGELKAEIRPGSSEIFPADAVIFAFGGVPELAFLEDVEGFVFDEAGTLQADPVTLMTSCPGVFAAGDVVAGYRSVAHAVGQGRRAAVSIDSYLTGKRIDQVGSIFLDQSGSIVIREGDKGPSNHVVKYDEIYNLDYYAKEPRVEAVAIPASEAATSFEEVDKGFRKEDAVKEASRCFHCGHCAMCGTCVQICPLDVLTMGVDGPEAAYPDECWHCGGCRINCPCSAVHYEFPLSMLI